MTDKRIENLNIKVEEKICTPTGLKNKYPLSEQAINTIMSGHQTIKNILDRKDKRVFVIVGPCSIHDTKAAIEYAKKLKNLSNEVDDTLYLVMRVYFEKPRTTTGWQGFIMDPDLDESHNVEEGLKKARKLLIEIAELGLPAAGEALDIVTPQYIQDLFSWTAIGARTTESQSHRKMASGFSSAVGLKNGTNGSIDIAINAIKATNNPHSFVSIDPNGHVAAIRTNGNAYSHIILRGGNGTNYDERSISDCEEKLDKAHLAKSIVVDCSHSNSCKKPENQPIVLNDIAHQIQNGNQSIVGVMLESHLNEGNQKIDSLEKLKYGVSITDSCIDWDTTEKTLKAFRLAIKNRINER